NRGIRPPLDEQASAAAIDHFQRDPMKCFDPELLALVTTVPAAHRELATNQRALLVDAAAHFFAIHRHAPAIFSALKRVHAVRAVVNQMLGDFIAWEQNDGESATNRLALGA